MSDKTRLEHELEQHEMHRTPFSIRILIVLLVLTIITAGVYIFKLRQDILKKEQEIVLMKEKLQKETEF